MIHFTRRKAATEWYKAAGIAMPAAPFTGVDALVAKLQARVDEVAPTLAFEARHKAPAIESGTGPVAGSGSESGAPSMSA